MIPSLFLIFIFIFQNEIPLYFFIKKTNMKLYVVYCKKYSKKQLQSFLEQFKGEASSISDINIVYNFKKRTDSNVNLVFLSKDVYERILEAGHTKEQRKDDINVVPYHIRAKNYPKEGESFVFYISLNKNISSDDYYTALTQKLDRLVKEKILDTSYKINIPLKDRISGSHYGYALVYFGPKQKSFDKQKETMLALTRLMLHGQPLDEFHPNERIIVKWYQKPQKYKKNREGARNEAPRTENRDKKVPKKKFQKKTESSNETSNETEEFIKKLNQHYQENE